MHRKNRSAERLGIGILAAAIFGLLSFLVGAPWWVTLFVIGVIIIGAIVAS